MAKSAKWTPHARVQHCDVGCAARQAGDESNGTENDDALSTRQDRLDCRRRTRFITRLREVHSCGCRRSQSPHDTHRAVVSAAWPRSCWRRTLAAATCSPPTRRSRESDGQCWWSSQPASSTRSRHDHSRTPLPNEMIEGCSWPPAAVRGSAAVRLLSGENPTFGRFHLTAAPDP